MFPLVYMVSLSFQPVGDILTFPPVLIPAHPTVVNYVQAWVQNNFAVYFFNSTVIALGTVVGTIMLSALTAYGFARYSFPGRELLFYVVMASLAVPSVLLVIPQYLLMKDLALLNSRGGLALLYISGSFPFSVFLLRSFFMGIPKDLEEAMRLDGVSELGILIRLIVPLSLSSLTVVGIFAFNYAWDEFVLAFTMISTQGNRTLPMAIALFQGNHVTEYGPLFAASVIAVLPVIVVFAVGQRWFQGGISVRAVR